jgi:hypothetical protein
MPATHAATVSPKAAVKHTVTARLGSSIAVNPSAKGHERRSLVETNTNYPARPRLLRSDLRLYEGAEREMVMMRWGMPPPPRAGGFPVTNIRNTASPRLAEAGKPLPGSGQQLC